MALDFNGTIYSNVARLCDAIAYEWMTAGGANRPADVNKFVAEMSVEALVQDCVTDWELDRIETEDPDGEGAEPATWMLNRDVDMADLIKAFQRFVADRPDLNR